MRLGTRRGTNRGRRSRWWRAAAPLAVAGLTVAGTVAATGDPAGSSHRRRDRPSHPEQHSSRSGREPAGTRRLPARFVAELDGRLVVVSARTGRIERYLAPARPGGDAEEPAVSPDGRTVWFSRGDGSCAAHLAAVPVAGGDEVALPGSGEAGPEGLPLPRPGRAQLAYARGSCTADTAESLMVGDMQGLEAYGQAGLAPVGWNRAGDRLLAVTSGGAEVMVLEVSEDGAILSDEVVAPTDRKEECRLRVVGFSPDRNDGYLAVRHCRPSDRPARQSLVLLDRAGRHRSTVVRLRRGHRFVDRIAFDQRGRSLLYSTVEAAPDGGSDLRDGEITMWVWRHGETRRLVHRSGYRHPSWIP